MMAREKNKLDGVDLISLPVGKHFDGGNTGLYFKVSKCGYRGWVQRISINGTRKEFGLGGAAFTPLEVARETAERNKLMAVTGTVEMPDALTRISIKGTDGPDLYAMKVEYAETLEAIDMATSRAKDLYAKIKAYGGKVK